MLCICCWTLCVWPDTSVLLLLYRFPYSLAEGSGIPVQFVTAEVCAWKRWILGGKLPVLINNLNIMDTSKFNFSYKPNGFPGLIFSPFSSSSLLLASAIPLTRTHPPDGTRLQAALPGRPGAAAESLGQVSSERCVQEPANVAFREWQAGQVSLSEIK